MDNETKKECGKFAAYGAAAGLAIAGTYALVGLAAKGIGSLASKHAAKKAAKLEAKKKPVVTELPKETTEP